MKKRSILGIVIGTTLLSLAPFSLHRPDQQHALSLVAFSTAAAADVDIDPSPRPRRRGYRGVGFYGVFDPWCGGPYVGGGFNGGSYYGGPFMDLRCYPPRALAPMLIGLPLASF